MYLVSLSSISVFRFVYYATVYSLNSNIRIGRDLWQTLYVIINISIALYVVTRCKSTEY